MKKIISIGFFLSVLLLCKAQGNLQFNQVLTGAGSLSTSDPLGSPCGTCCYNYPAGTANSATLTVPQGKVWKVEVATPGNSLVINGVSGINITTNGPGGAYGNPSTVNQVPIWLKSGDNFYFSVTSPACNCCGQFTNPVYSITYFYSIIEYNIVQ